MGFFSDLKEDLSQAVNELMPEEQLDAAMAQNESVKKEETENKDEKMTSAADVDLSSMLDKLDDMELPDDTLPEETITDMLPETEPVPAVEETEKTEAEEQPESQESILEDVYKNAVEKETEKNSTAYHYDKGEEKKMDVQKREVADETAIVTAGMSITGDIVSEGSLELIGAVNGNIDVLGKLNVTGSIQGNSKAAEIYAEGAKINGEVNSLGSVKIGQSSVIIGNISANSAVIAGAVKGDIDVQGPVILDASAIVMGNIKSKSVQINNGAVIEGMCSQCYADVNPTSFFEEFKKKTK